MASLPLASVLASLTLAFSPAYNFLTCIRVESDPASQGPHVTRYLLLEARSESLTRLHFPSLGYADISCLFRTSLLVYLQGLACPTLGS